MDKQNLLADHAISLLLALNQLRADELEVGSCDLRLMVGEQHVHAHKLVLVAVSDYFRAMFAHNFVEKDLSEVRLSGMEYEDVKAAVNFIYSGVIDVNDDSVDGLLVVATHLQIGLLVQACERYLFEKISVVNVGDIETMVERYSLSALRRKVEQFIRDNILSLATNNKEFFCNITIDRLRKFLDDDAMKVQDETSLVNLIRLWVLERRSERVDYLIDLLSRLRSSAVSHFPALAAEFQEVQDTIKHLSDGHLRLRELKQHGVSAHFKPRLPQPCLAVYYDGGDFRHLERQFFRRIGRDVFEALQRNVVQFDVMHNVAARQIAAGDTLACRNCHFLKLNQVGPCSFTLVGKPAFADQSTQSDASGDSLANDYWPACSVSALQFLVSSTVLPANTDQCSVSAGANAALDGLAKYSVWMVLIGGRRDYSDSPTSISPFIYRMRCSQNLLSDRHQNDFDVLHLNGDAMRFAALNASLPVAEHAACTLITANGCSVFVSGGLSFFDGPALASMQQVSWVSGPTPPNFSVPSEVPAAWNRCVKLQFSGDDGELVRFHRLPELNEPRSYHAMLEYHGSLYVVGGVRRGDRPSDRQIAIETLNLESECDESWRWTVIELPSLTGRCTMQFAVLDDEIYTINRQDADAGWNGIYRLHFDGNNRASWTRCRIQSIRPPASGRRNDVQNQDSVFSFAHCFPAYLPENS